MCGGSVGKIIGDIGVGIATGGVGLLAKKGFEYQRKKKKSAQRKSKEVRDETERTRRVARDRAKSREPIKTVYGGDPAQNVVGGQTYGS